MAWDVHLSRSMYMITSRYADAKRPLQLRFTLAAWGGLTSESLQQSIETDTWIILSGSACCALTRGYSWMAVMCACRVVHVQMQTRIYSKVYVLVQCVPGRDVMHHVFIAADRQTDR